MACTTAVSPPIPGLDGSTAISEPHIIRSERFRKRQPGATPVPDATVGQQHATSANASQGREETANGPREEYSARARLRRVDPRHYLGYLSTSSLMLNRIIGTGVFISPGQILALTGSKTVTLVLWLVGGAITWAGMVVYLEYGLRWPLTGGELHYVDRVWTRPEKFFTYLYSFMFVVVAGSHTNALVFGSSMLYAAAPDSPIDQRAQKFLALVLVAAVCLFQTFSRLNYIRFSNLFAMYKVALLSIISIIGFAVLGGVRSRFAVPGPYGVSNLENDIHSGAYSAYGMALSLLSVARAFTGYENVNYVLEEVQRPPSDKNRIYRRGMEMSIAIVTLLYITVNVAFFAACTSEEVIAAPDLLALFFSRVFGGERQARVASSILLSLSSAGNVMSATYTNVRVKQEIARMGLIPLPEFWADTTRYDTPGPALLLHFIFTALFILAAPLGDSAGFLVFSTITNYCRTVVGSLLGFGLMAAPWIKAWQRDDKKWQPGASRLRVPWLVYPLALLFTISNIYIFALYWFPSGMQEGLRNKSPILSSRVGPITCMAIYGGAAVYWLWDRMILGTLGYEFSLTDSEISREEDSLDVEIIFKRAISNPARRVITSITPTLASLKRLWISGFGDSRQLDNEVVELGSSRRVQEQLSTVCNN